MKRALWIGAGTSAHGSFAPAVELDAVSFRIANLEGGELRPLFRGPAEPTGPFLELGERRNQEPGVQVRRAIDRLAALEGKQHAGTAGFVVIGLKTERVRIPACQPLGIAGGQIEML